MARQRPLMGPALTLFGIEHEGQVCRRCFGIADQIDPESVMPLPPKALAPLARDGSGPCCWDCAAAETLMQFMGLDFVSARVSVAADRLEQLRLPGAPMGLVLMGFVRPSSEGDMGQLFGWQASLGLRPWEEDDDE